MAARRGHGTQNKARGTTISATLAFRPFPPVTICSSVADEFVHTLQEISPGSSVAMDPLSLLLFASNPCVCFGNYVSSS